MRDVAATKSPARIQAEGYSSDLISLLSQKVVGQGEELSIYNEHNFPVYFKPFVACDVLNLIRRYPRMRVAVN